MYARALWGKCGQVACILGSEDAQLSVVLENEFMALHVGTSLVIYAQIIGLKIIHTIYLSCV